MRGYRPAEVVRGVIKKKTAGSSVVGMTGISEDKRGVGRWAVECDLGRRGPEHVTENSSFDKALPGAFLEGNASEGR